MFKAIITGIDLGPETGRVLSYAAYIASCTRADLRLLYVMDYMMTPPTYLSGYVEEEKKREEKEMEVWKERLQTQGISADTEIIMGRLHESFVSAIQKSSSDLLVIGYKSHMLRPSSSERLIQSLTIPMLVVRGKHPEAAGGSLLPQITIRKILCPVDFSNNSLHAVSTAKGLAALFSAELHLLHVVRPDSCGETIQQTEEGGEKKLTIAGDKEALSRLAALCREHGIASEGRTAVGIPAEVITSAAEEKGFDLIVMGARGISYMQAVLIGSTTEAVLKSAPYPVFIVH